MNRRILSNVGVLCFVAAGVACADQITSTWTNPVSGSWNTAGNWSGAVVPNNGGGATYKVVVDGNAANNVVVTANGNFVIDQLVVDLADQVIISNLNTLTLATSADLSNAGTLSLSSAGNNTDLVMGANISLSGGGTVTMSNQAANRILGSVSTNRLTNVDNTIQGSGQIGVNLMTLTNQAGGVIEATQSNTLTIDPSASGAINQGTLRARNNATLNLSGGTFTNTGGIIEAQTGSTVQLSSATVVGGTLTTSGTGVITNGGASTLNGVTNLGAFSAANNITTTVIGTLANSGSIALNSSGNLTDLVMSGDVTLSGGGTVTMSNQANNRIYGVAGTDRLTNVDNTIQGSGQLGVSQMALTNQGTISATGSAGLTVDPSASGAINTGTMQALSGPLTLQGGTFTNTGGIIRSNPGTVNVNNATVNGGIVEVLGAGTISMVGGTITGGTLNNSSAGIIRSASGSNTLGGTVNNVAGGQIIVNNNATLILQGGGTYTNAGTISMNGAGNLTDLMIDGNVTLSGGGTLTIGNNTSNRIFGFVGTNRLTNADNKIQGSGLLAANQMALTNQAAGVIEANQSVAMTIDPSASGAINQGTLRASNNSILNLNGGTFTNTGGTIDAQTGSAVQLSGATVVGGSLTTSGSGVVRNVSSATLNGVTNLGTFSADNNSGTTLIGTITNSASMALNSAGNITDLAMSGDVTLTGGGTLTLSNNGNNRILGIVGTERLTNVNNTIQGSGQIGTTFMALTNQAGGVIEANQSVALTIDPSAGGAINQGTLRARNNATLILNPGTFTNTGGTIEAQTGSTVQLSGATIVGGLLTTSGSGVIRNTSTATLDGVTIGSTVSANNATTTTLIGTITNGGLISLNSGGSLTDVRLSGDVTLTGGGTLDMSNNTNNRILGTVGANRLINVNNTIQGSGQIGVNLMGFTNQGTVLANQSALLTIDTSSGFTNQGILQSLAGSTLSIIGAGTEFSNFAGTTLTGGSYLIGSGTSTTATIQFDNADIVTNQATIVMDGSGARILNRNTILNGISNLTTNGAQGDFTIRNGKNLSTNAAFSNAGGVTVGDLSTLTIGAGAGVFTNSGTLDGTGTIVGTVINSGSVNPGSSPGTLTVNGTYNQSAGGALNIEIASLSSFDQLFVLGQAFLDGTLNVSLLGGYLPSVGDSFQFMQFSSLTGAFANLNGLNIGGGLFFSQVVTASGISLVVGSEVPEPGTWLLLGLGLAAIAARRRLRWTKNR